MSKEHIIEVGPDSETAIDAQDPMTAQERTWLNHAMRYGGAFIATFAKACLYADDANFAVLQSALIILMAKYLKYGDAVIWRIEQQEKS